jgi:hypothetical protein
LDILRLEPLRPLFYFEFDLNPVIEAAISVHGNRAEVNKYIFAGGPLDKSVALGVIEPLNHSTFSLHYFFS